jgi:hypothetical protein
MILLIGILALVFGINLSYCLRLRDENEELRSTIRIQNMWLESYADELEKR